MGREVRKVPSYWQHPVSEEGHYIPLCPSSHIDDLQAFETAQKQWGLGFYEGEIKTEDMNNCSYAEWVGEPTLPEDCMPLWTDEEATHYMMYETTTEGTPISPALETLENLARWLADNKASAFGRMTATYEQWLSVCNAEYIPSLTSK